MNYVLEDIAARLKQARAQKGLSQRALSKTSGVPQGHISKIESGAVDLRVSSLIELARALDLELTLVPRKAVPAVRSILRNNASSDAAPGPATKELERMGEIVARMQENNRANKETIQLQNQLRDLKRFQNVIKDVGTLKSVNHVLQFYQRPKNYTSEDLEEIRKIVMRLREMRNRLAHDLVTVKSNASRPAYRLEDDDHA